eukprot:TRINITY_DN3316_c0_g1_i4.p1 TRINITY_DN3316_c0_g1~~TRINITY_DN3316_c0_g1_i4.p1  ORF type:complete len:162 (+),score=15.07 TRINITY_DN3316_c0_g1_i4:573-1058(+)
MVALNEHLNSERVAKRSKNNSEAISAPGPNWPEILASIVNAASFEDLQATQSDGCFKFQDLKEGMKYAATLLGENSLMDSDPDMRRRALVFLVVSINKLMHPTQALPAIFSPTEVLRLIQRVTVVSEELLADTTSKIVLSRDEIAPCVSTLFSVAQAGIAL